MRAHVRALMTRKSYAVGMRNAILKNYLKGNFKGRSYDAPPPPSLRPSNSKICEGFRDSISETLLDWVTAGVLDV